MFRSITRLATRSLRAPSFALQASLSTHLGASSRVGFATGTTGLTDPLSCATGCAKAGSCGSTRMGTLPPTMGSDAELRRVAEAKFGKADADATKSERTMSVSVLDMFKVGVGPSSSHTVGPMKAARSFVAGLSADKRLADVKSMKAELFGSLGLTGHGHGTGKAVLLGLEGDMPDTVDVETMESRLEAMDANKAITLDGAEKITFDPKKDLIYHRKESLPQHPNAMRLIAYDADGAELARRDYFSIGGGFVLDEDQMASGGGGDTTAVVVPHPFDTGDELLQRAQESGLAISEVMRENELARRSSNELDAGLERIWNTMEACVERGISQDGILPGGLNVHRRAKAMHAKLTSDARDAKDPLLAMDWANLYALAVNEENAAGGRVVTAPTNGAAGIIPAVLHYHMRQNPGSTQADVQRFLLTAGAIGTLYKRNGSISGAEVGCQGEVGVATSMAAAGLTEVMGGTPAQVERAAEIGMEHNLGLTCDPVGGLVQIPCIERNAMGSVQAINAARLALLSDGTDRKVSLDTVIKTMMDIGKDMDAKYKETAEGGLAVNFVAC